MKNPESVQKGVKQIEMNRQKIEGQILPLCGKKRCKV